MTRYRLPIADVWPSDLTQNQSRKTIRMRKTTHYLKLFSICLWASNAFGQGDDRVTLVVDVANAVTYRSDVIDPAARGNGIGRALIDDLVTLARGKGWKRLYWHTRHDNAKARALYDQYVCTDDHIRYRMTL